VLWLFFKVCSGTSFKRSEREISNDVAEHRFILKNKQDVSMLIFFSRWTKVQSYHSKDLGKSFPLMRLNIGLC